MTETNHIQPEVTDPAQALALFQLVELEARWENLRPSAAQPARLLTKDQLQARQKAYEVFHAKLLTYNRRYKPTHAAETLLNTPIRLSRWCRDTSALCRRVEGDSKLRPPVSLAEKAYRSAARLAGRVGSTPPAATAPPATFEDAIRSLEEVAAWGETLVNAVPAA